MSFTTLCASGLSQALNRALLGERFTMRGDTFLGAIDDLTASESFQPSGSVAMQPVSITMKLRTFSPALNLGERVTARGANYTVRQLITDEVSITLVCDLEHR